MRMAVDERLTDIKRDYLALESDFPTIATIGKSSEFYLMDS